MKTLSVCIIVKNEEETLGRLLDSVIAFADEIIVVDTGSTDKTKEIALNYTQKVYDFEWCDDFSKARNYSFEKATADYIIWLDADDFVPEYSQKLLTLLKDDLIDEDVVMLPYEIAFDINGKPNFKYFRERIIKNNAGFVWQEPVHEVIVPRGKIIYKEIPIQHKKIRANTPFRNLNIYQKLISSKTQLSARQEFYYANELFYNDLYDEAITIYNKFLSNENGMVENKIQACINLSKIYAVKNQLDNAIKHLTNSFIYGKPSAEALCQLGNLFLSKKEYLSAIYWYSLAIQPLPSNSKQFIEVDAYKYIPYVQIGLCYYYLGDVDNAILFNSLAMKEKPNDKITINNDRFYNKIKKGAR